MTPSTILTQAAELISKPGAWTQGAFARDEDGANVEIEAGICFCAYGALAYVVADNPGFSRAVAFLDSVVSPSAFAWNDAPNRTQDEVVAALRLAADLAREAGE